MFAGVALLGVVTATLASWLVEKVTDQDDETEAVTQAQVAALQREIAALRADLEASPSVQAGELGP
jgi:voltage-gated potassium channel